MGIVVIDMKNTYLLESWIFIDFYSNKVLFSQLWHWIFILKQLFLAKFLPNNLCLLKSYMHGSCFRKGRKIIVIPNILLHVFELF